jgi:hypothetical protein
VDPGSRRSSGYGRDLRVLAVAVSPQGGDYGSDGMATDAPQGNEECQNAGTRQQNKGNSGKLFISQYDDRSVNECNGDLSTIGNSLCNLALTTQNPGP